MHLETRVLVTGGAGFLGSHLCERLIKDGASVVCADNFFTGARRNLDGILDHHRFELLRHDVTFPLYIESGPDLQSGLPCLAGPLSARSCVQTTKASVHGAINMPAAGRRFAREKILRRQRRKCYGDPHIPSANRRLLGISSIQRAHAPVTMRASVAQETLFFGHWRRNSIAWSRSRGSLIPTGRTCILTMVASYRTSLYRRYWTATSLYLAMAYRHDHSPTSTILSMAPSGCMNTVDEVTGPINIGNPKEFSMLGTGVTGHRAHRIRARGSFTAAASGRNPQQRRPDTS